jgi:hypothetical protein
MFLLFVAEPLILRRHFHGWATARPKLAFAWLQGAHWLLVGLSLITILGAVAGSHGGNVTVTRIALRFVAD